MSNFQIKTYLEYFNNNKYYLSNMGTQKYIKLYPAEYTPSIVRMRGEVGGSREFKNIENVCLYVYPWKDDLVVKIQSNNFSLHCKITNLEFKERCIQAQNCFGEYWELIFDDEKAFNYFANLLKNYQSYENLLF